MSWASAERDGGGRIELPYGVSLRTVTSYIVDLWGHGDTGTVAIPETKGALTVIARHRFRTRQDGDETVVEVEGRVFRFKT